MPTRPATHRDQGQPASVLTSAKLTLADITAAIEDLNGGKAHPGPHFCGASFSPIDRLVPGPCSGALVWMHIEALVPPLGVCEGHRDALVRLGNRAGHG